MRIYLPLTAPDRQGLESAARSLQLAAGRPAWAVTEEARADRPGEDEEDLEYDALQDAVHVALTESTPTARALVIAADVPDHSLVGASGNGGAFGVALQDPALAKIASFHVTEQEAQAAQEDDTDPALLWFDASEGIAALAFLDGGAVD